MPEYKYFYNDTKQIGLKYSSTQIANEQIRIRLMKMFENGLIDEVVNLKNKYKNISLTAYEAIEYKQTFEYLNGKYTLNELKEIIILKTTQLYKKQIKWFKRDKRINWKII